MRCHLCSIIYSRQANHKQAHVCYKSVFIISVWFEVTKCKQKLCLLKIDSRQISNLQALNIYLTSQKCKCNWRKSQIEAFMAFVSDHLLDSGLQHASPDSFAQLLLARSQGSDASLLVGDMSISLSTKKVKVRLTRIVVCRSKNGVAHTIWGRAE